MNPRSIAAAEMLPVRLMISIAMIVTIVILVVVAAGNLQVFLAEQEIETACRSLQASLCTMVADGAFRDVDDLSSPEGTKRIHTFKLPDTLMYLSFGGDPDPADNGSRTSELLEDGSVIVYKVAGGSKKIIWLPIETYKFREGRFDYTHWVLEDQGNSFLITSGGTVTLVFECVQKRHQKFILIHQNDERNSW